MDEMGITRVTWRKSTRSNGSGNCVEVADDLAGKVSLRDSKDSGGPILTFAAPAWRTFIGVVKAESRWL
ncbi:DUF397 domain-containing protein [Salinispora sp. H7-4]|uniref:DUF397 domain-containing protein n=1 Tax=Salinispora sp. H7-4 TaxID=2748321 RepID=UPI0015D2F0CA|nr:DUF397 domain-containing protein [Salinispora sp. H7-4]NYT96500.1 DUF397 domain-containing protein [Salinispora sp. H7-4]